MAHPGNEWLGAVEAAKERTAILTETYFRPAVFATARRRNLSSIQESDEIHPVAHAEHGCDLERCELRCRNVLAVHRVRPAAQDDPGRGPVTNPLDRTCGRVDLRVDARLTNAPGDQLGVL